MATKFPKFSQALAQDPATRRIWYGIATAHDLEAHDGMTEENLYQKIFASHFGHLAIIFLWTSGNLFHVAWQGNFEKWVTNPLKVKPIAHSIWDPHFGESALKAFSKGNTYPVNIAFQVYINGGIQLDLEQIKNYIKVQLVYYYYHQLYYLLVGYIYNQNSVQVYHGLKIMNLV
jgi:hypothetical protein